MSTIDAFVREISGLLISNVLDPNPVRFKSADKKGVGPVKAGCTKEQGSLHIFRSQLNRNAFLYGCREFTAEAPVEHLVVGFGFRDGPTTVVEQMAHAVGDTGSVGIPLHVNSAIREFVSKHHQNEVLLFHNHPHGQVNVIFDNLPLPSPADRRTLMSFYRDVTMIGKALFGGGRVRFYVGENGYVQEFRTPDLLPLVDRVIPSGAQPQ